MIVEYLKPQDVINTSLYTLFSISNTSGFQNIQGITRLKFLNGQAIFSPEKFFAHPNSEVFLKITTPNILRYYNELFSTNSNLFDLNLYGSYAFVFSIKLRDCIVGEIFLSQINRFFKINFFFLILCLYKVAIHVPVENTA